MRKKFLLMLTLLILALGGGGNLFAENVAKVDNTEYATIEEAIANWTNGTTLTLLADVTLSDVIQLSSTEHHILDLGIYTMTAFSEEKTILWMTYTDYYDAIKIVNNGRNSASYALDIKADAENPGGITATNKAVVSTTGKSDVKDRPIIRFYNGVFNSSYVVYHTGSNGTNCPQFYFYGGEFNGTIYADRAKFIFEGGTFNGSLNISVDSNADALVKGGKFKNLSNNFGSTLNTDKFTIGSDAGVYDRGIYVDKDGYYVITSAPITKVSAKYPAVKKESYGSNNYFKYSAAATYGMFYEVASMATGNNVTKYEHADVVAELDNNTAVNNFTPVLPEEVKTFEVDAIDIEATTEATTKVTFNVEPKNASGAKVSNPSAAIAFRLPVPAAWSGKANVYHESVLLDAYTIKEESGAKFVEVSSSSFSEFSVEAIVPTEVEVATLAELQAALADNSNELPIIITAQIEIPAGETVELDLNGKTVTVVYQEGSDTKHIYALNNYGTLTITDSKDNGSIKARGILVQADSKITIGGGSIYGIDSNGGSALFQYGGDIVINGGLVEQEAEGTYNFAINAAGGSVTVNGGKIAGNHGAIATGGAAVVINDGVLVCTGTAGMTDNVLYTYGTGTIEINGGTFVADNDIPAGGCCVYDANGGATINGGTFGNSSGGDVWGTTGTTIKGGTFENLTETQHIAAGYELNGDGTVTAIPVAEVNGVNYTSFAEAAAAAQAGDEIKLLANIGGDITVPANVTLNGNGFAVSGAITAAGEITFAGVTKTGNFGVENTNTVVNIPDGASLQLIGTGRMVIGHGCTFNITGTIADAKNANVADVTPSLVMPGASFTGAGVTFNVTNAYISVPSSFCSSSKTASGTFDFNITNSIWENASKLAFESQSTAATVNFDLKNSVLNTGSHLVFGVSRGEIVVDNSNVNVGKSNQIENQSTMTIKNGSVVNGAVATSSNAKNPGTIIVENATYAVTGEFSGSDLGTGTLTIKKGATVSAGSITKANIIIDATDMAAGDDINLTANLSNLAGELSVINNDDLEAKIVDGKIVLAAKPVAKIGEQGYATLEEAFAAATEGQTIAMLDDATPALTSQRAITKAAVIDLGGKTLTLTEDDLYFGTTTFKNGTIIVDPSVKPSTAVFWMFANQTLTFDNVKIVATGVTGTYLIGLEGENSDLNLLNGSEILVENTTALDLDIICVNGTNTCDIKVENSKVNVTNLDGRVFFRGNYTVKDSEVNLAGITKAGFRIEAGQTLSIEGTSKVNIEGELRDGGIHLTDLSATYTKAETATVNATVNEPKVAKVGENTYRTLAQAVEAVEDGGTITLIANETFTKNNRFNNGGWWDGLGYSGDKSFTIDLNGFTVSQDGSLNDYLFWFKNVGSKENTITIKNGTLDAGTTAFCALCTASSHDNKLTVSTENVNLINNISNGSTVKVRAGSVLNVNAGTVITGKNSYLGIENWNATVNIYDGAEIYMNGTSSYNGCLVGVGGGGTVNVYGGYGKGVKGGFIAMTSGGTINVAGGEWIANTDGSVGNNSNLYVLTAQSNKKESGFAGPSIINVTDGTFRGGMDAWVLNNIEGEKAELNISGGNFNVNPSRYVEAGYVVVENNGVWNVVKAAAKIGEQGYATLQDAINAAQEGETVKVVADVEYAIDPSTFTAKHADDDAALFIAADDKLTLDLNGYTISVVATLAAGETTKHSGAIINNGNLTIDDSSDAKDGKITFKYVGAYDGGSKRHGVVMNLGTLTVNAGTLENLTQLENQQAIDNTNYNGTEAFVVINGGTIKSAGYYAIDMIGYYDFAPALKNSVVVKGGTIDGGIYARTQANTNLSLNIEGGTIKSDFAEAVRYRVYYTGNTHSISVTDGEFSTTNEDAQVVRVQLPTGETLEGFIEGGTYNKAVEENLVAPGFACEQNTNGTYGITFAEYIVLPTDVDINNYKEKFGDNTVTDGTNYYATLQAAVEAVAGTANAVLYCKPGADVGSLQHAPVTSTLTVYGNNANVINGGERDFDLGNTDPNGGRDITANMTLTVKYLNGCGVWGAKATAHTVNLVFENCDNMGKVFISGTTGTLNITMTDCAFEGVLPEAIYSNADGAISLNNVAFSNLNKAVNLNHKAAGTQTVTINGCSFTNCGNDVTKDEIPVRVLTSVAGGNSVLTVTGCTFSGTPEGGADILLDYGVGLTEATVSNTAAKVVVEKENNVGETTIVTAEETMNFTNSDGSADRPYIINNLADLKAFRDAVNAGNNYSGKFVKLTADIDLNQTRSEESNWTPIGTSLHPFQGTFDGQNHTISNLKCILDHSVQRAALFGQANNATIKNVTVNNVECYALARVSAIVGGATTTTVENCHVTGNINLKACQYVGAIVGYGYATIKDCSVTGTEENIATFTSHLEGCTTPVENSHNQMYIGGIAGWMGEGNSSITNCHVSYAKVEGWCNIGGVTGLAHYGNTVDKCSVNNVTVTGDSQKDPNRVGTIGLIAGGCAGTENEPTTITDVVVEESTATDANVSVYNIYGNNPATGVTPYTNYVAQIVGGTQYTSVIEALQAAIDTEASELVILKDVREKMTVDFDLVINSDLTITAAKPVKVEFYNEGTAYDFAVGSNNNTLTIAENVHFDLTDRVIWLGYYGNNVKVVVNGYLGGYQIWHGADTKVTATGKLDSHGEAFIMRRNATLTVEEGEVNANYFQIYSGHIKAEDATITAGLVWINNNHSYGSEGTVSMSLDNTTFTSRGEVKVYAGEGKQVPITLTNGTTFTAAGALTTGENVVVKADATSDFIVKGKSIFVAETGGYKYPSLATAIEAVEEGATVTVISDITLAETATIAAGKVVTLDLNGKTITGKPSVAAAYAVIYNNGDLTIKNGSVICDHTLAGSTSYAVNAITNCGTLTIDGATIENKSTASNQIGYAIDNNSTSANAELVVKNGNVIVSGSSVYYDGIRQFCNSETKENSVIINGGVVSSLWMQNPSDNSTGRNTKDVKGSFTIEGGTLNALYIEPSRSFSGLISAGHVASISRFDSTDEQNEERLLAGFITGGTFSMDVNEYCHEYYDAVEGDNGIWTIEQVLFAQTTSLNRGWNWYSSYINLSSDAGLTELQNALDGKGIEIKGKTGYSDYQYIGEIDGVAQYKWYKTDDFLISAKQMYMIKTTEAVEIMVDGVKMNPETTIITLRPGWNWIGYPVAENLSINVALAGLDAEDGDVIKSRGGESEYIEGYGWIGDLLTMEPGVGYMYYSQVKNSFTYSMNTRGEKYSNENITADNNHWVPEASQYANNMSIVAMLNIEGETMMGNYEIAAFVDGECRGSARPVYIEALDSYVVFMTVFGEESEELTFKYYDINNETESELKDVLTYSSDTRIGSARNPYMFYMNTLNIEESTLDMINIYPNPTTTDRAINLQATCDNVEVFNALGVKVAEYQNVDTIDAIETAGVYVIRVTINGETRNCRLVVK